MSKIVAVSGRKQSGKSSLCAYIQARLAQREWNDYVSQQRDVHPESAGLEVSFIQRLTGEIDWFSDSEGGPTRITSRDEIAAIEAYAKAPVYNFADSLKRACLDLLGLKHEQCYGTDEQKNTPTKLRWESLPLFVRWTNSGRRLFLPMISEEVTLNNKTSELDFYNAVHAHNANPHVFLKRGEMTGREVMQVFGTDVMRKMFHDNVWVTATVSRIQAESPVLALIADMRFRSEFFALRSPDVYVIRLERDILHDPHSSEVDFDGFDFTEHERTLVIPQDTNLADKNEIAWNWLLELGVV